ncbi:MAG: exodeoxyribonuclease III [Desulfobulbus propionicus]|nr:MAG: exodeoxyribonuclease III [Desulfobulbus propionicus]
MKPLDAVDIDFVLPLIKKEVARYQVPVVDLVAIQTRDPFKVLVATVLSARTRDETTAAAAKRLFEVASTPDQLAALTVAELEKLIYPVGFFRNKARYLHDLPRILSEKFSGLVPDTIEELIQLPGVGRKTANLVRAVAFHKPAICVDTHVHRIMNIWGYVCTDTPFKTEMALREKLPQKYWQDINSILVAYGQGTCKPQRPLCESCIIEKLCPKIGVIKKKKMAKNKKKEGQRFVSWNVNGLRAALKKDFLASFHSLEADIFALQEIKALPEQLPDEVLNIPGYQAYWNAARKKGYSGTATFTRKEPQDVLYGLGEPQFDEEGRVLTLEYSDFYLINAYFPNAQPALKRIQYKVEFNRALQAFMEELRQKKGVVLCGDLNVAHKPIDLARPKQNEENPGYSSQERAWIEELLSSGYIDTFREFNTGEGEYSWWTYRANARANNVGWRIDYFIVDQASLPRLVDASIHQHIMGSDHCPVSLYFK